MKRRVIVVDGPLAFRMRRVEAARASVLGLEVLSLPLLATRLAGGLTSRDSRPLKARDFEIGPQRLKSGCYGKNHWWHSNRFYRIDRTTHGVGLLTGPHPLSTYLFFFETFLVFLAALRSRKWGGRAGGL
jgi:hypothetical protein